MQFLVFDIFKRSTRPEEHEGFFHGAHHISPEHGISEIDARAAQMEHEAEKASIERTLPLEAELKHLNTILPSAEADWEHVRDELNGTTLRVVMPAIVLATGVGALATDVLMLAPSLDLLSITDPQFQLIAASGLAGLGSVLLHLGWETLEPCERTSRAQICIWRSLGMLTAAALVNWGILRGYQVAFASQITGNPLATFLALHPLLASLFFVFITLGAPLAAASAVTYGARHVRDWYRYRRAKRQFEHMSQRRDVVAKKIEAERAALEHELRILDSRRQEAGRAYLRQHQRGAMNGAKQSPFWLVQLAAAGSAMATLALSWWLFALSPFSGLLPAVAYIGAFLYFRHQRIHPTPAEFYELERVQFAEASADEEPDHFAVSEISHDTLNALVNIGRSSRDGDRR